MPKGAPKKQLIVQGAIRTFLRVGISDTKTKDIAHEAGVDQPLINYYYPTFDALFIDVFREVGDNLREVTIQYALRQPNNPVETLKNYILAPFDWASKNPGFFSIWLYFYHLAATKDSFAQLDTAIRTGGRERISLLIYEGIEKRKFQIPAGSSVTEMAILIQGLITGNTIMAGTETPTQFKQFSKMTQSHVLWLLQPKGKNRD